MENLEQHPPAQKDTSFSIDGKIDGVLASIDNGNVFKTIIVYLFRIMNI